MFVEKNKNKNFYKKNSLNLETVCDKKRFNIAVNAKHAASDGPIFCNFVKKK